MLTCILIIWVVLGIAFVAIGSKGTFFVEDIKNISRLGYAIGIVLLCLCAPVIAVIGIVEGIEEIMKD